MDLQNWPSAVAIVLGALLTVALARHWPSEERRRLRTLLAFTAAYLATLGLGQLGAALLWPAAAAVAANVSSVVGWVAIISMGGLLLFKLTLPQLGLRPPSIVGDLFVGAAFFVLAIAVLRDFGVDPTSLVATSAVVTGIIALSLQPTLGNVIGGVALQVDRSVRVGDWLRLDNGKEGVVREIRWRHTVLETRDWDTIIVPNANLLAANIMILGKRQGQPRLHRMWVRFNVDFRFRPTQVIRVVEEALHASPRIVGVADSPRPDCVCLDFSSDSRDSFAVYAVRYWLDDLQIDDPTSSRVRQRMFAALRRARIPLAIPATQLFMDIDSSERREQKLKDLARARLAALSAVDFLSVLEPAELERIARGLETAPFAAGETMTRQGDEAHWLYVLAEGEAEVWIDDGTRRRQVATLRAPTFFGEMGLMTGAPRSATVIAATAVVCHKLGRDAFGEILAQRPGVAEGISSILATRGVELESARSELGSAAARAEVDDQTTQLLGRIQKFFGLN